jgi:phosphoribosylanthranilate isomerase
MVIKAVRVKESTTLNAALKTECDLLLLDAYQDGAAGGTGKTFDWKLLKDFSRPFILAGGLNCTNLQHAIETVNPYGVDVSSGVETGGFKDPVKIKDFIHIAKEVNHD